MTGILLTLVSRGSTTLSYTAVPVISGTATERSVLTVNNGTWLGAVPITYSYQWFSNNAPVASGVTSYTVQTSDIGNTIYCAVAATNFYGTIVANSANTTVITQSAPSKPVVTASNITQTSITLTWTPSVSGVTGYDVYVGTTKINDTTLPNSTLTYSTISNDSINTRVFMNGENLLDYSASQNGFINTSVETSTTKFAYGAKSLYFNGASRLVFPGNSLSNFGTGEFTIEFWLSTTMNTADSNSGVIGCNTNYSPANVWIVMVNWTGWLGKLVFMLNGSIELVSSININDGTLRHFAIVRSGTSLKLYINGNLDYTASSASTQVYGTTVGMVLGCRNGSETTPVYSNYFTGYLDEIRVSNAAKYTAAFTPAQLSYGYKMSPQTAYTYYVKATNAIAVTSSDALTVISDANAPTGLTQSSMTSGGFTLSWTVTSGVSYTIFNGSTQIGDPQTTGNVAITGLSPQTPYTFYVKATSTGSTNAISSAGYSITTAPAAPTGLSATAIGQNGFTLNWTGIAGLTYQILNNASSVVTGIVGTNGAMSYNVTGLGTYTSYPSFYVKASNVSNGVTSTAQSSPLSVQTIKAVLNLSGAFGSLSVTKNITNAYLVGLGLNNAVPTDIYINGLNAYQGTGGNGSWVVTVSYPLSGAAAGSTLTLTINSGEGVWGKPGTYTTGAGPAMNIEYTPSSGKIYLVNNGTICGGGGCGGRGGGGPVSNDGSNGGGGNVGLYIYGNGSETSLYITNNNKIAGGGGGGGGGGAGTGTSSTAATQPSAAGTATGTGSNGTTGAQSPGGGTGGTGGGPNSAGNAGNAGTGGYATGGAGGSAGPAIQIASYSSYGNTDRIIWLANGTVGTIQRF